GWLGSLTLPAPVRSAVQGCADGSAGGDRSTMAREVTALARVAEQYLDHGARSELAALAAALSD
ncbi:MAG: hypothetical protein H0W68_03760, partial [Gemmatimonadaceae bacterium]|nr:hypothetical protein [Gemmatimonadaceae bacterium]